MTTLKELVAGAATTAAGASTVARSVGGHQSARARTTTWLTPRYILESLGPFDLDPCSAPDPVLWPSAARHYTWPQQDGLALPWSGRVWVNPPYGRELGRWMDRLAGHGRGTALIFARTETAIFVRSVWERADAAMFLEGRLHFHHADGRPAKDNCGAPSVLCAYGAEDVERLMESGLKGMLVGLRRPVLIHLSLACTPGEATAHGATTADELTTWRDVVTDVLRGLGGRGSLSDLYTALEQHPKASGAPHWRAKVRQTCGRMGLIKQGRATYALAA